MEKVTAEMHVEIGRILAEMVDMIGKIHDEIVVEKIKMVVENAGLIGEKIVRKKEIKGSTNVEHAKMQEDKEGKIAVKHVGH